MATSVAISKCSWKIALLFSGLSVRFHAGGRGSPKFSLFGTSGPGIGPLRCSPDTSPSLSDRRTGAGRNLGVPGSVTASLPLSSESGRFLQSDGTVTASCVPSESIQKLPGRLGMPPRSKPWHWDQWVESGQSWQVDNAIHIYIYTYLQRCGALSPFFVEVACRKQVRAGEAVWASAALFRMPDVLQHIWALLLEVDVCKRRWRAEESQLWWGGGTTPGIPSS